MELLMHVYMLNQKSNIGIAMFYNSSGPNSILLLRNALLSFLQPLNYLFYLSLNEISPTPLFIEILLVYSKHPKDSNIKQVPPFA